MDTNYQNTGVYGFSKTHNKKNWMYDYLYIILTVMYIFAYNNDLRNQSLLVWYAISAVAIGFLAFVIAYSPYKEQSIGVYAMWAGVFFAYTFISGFWAINESEYFSKIKSLFLLFIVNILLSFVITTKKDVKKLLFINFLALLFYLIYVLLKVDFSQLGEDRLGVGLLGERWNANDVGIKLCIGFAFSLYYTFERKTVWGKLLAAVIAVIFACISFLSGSRTAFLLLVLIGVGMFFLMSKNKVLAVGVIVAFVAIAYLLVMRVEPLYNVLGKRLESLIINLFGGDTSEGSFDTRAEMIKLGWNAFLERPIFGYGLGGSFLIYEEALDAYTYAHNNFIETLLNGGLVGFIIYYFIYAYILVKLFKRAYFKCDKVAICLLVINIGLLIMQIGTITYNSTLDNSVLMLAVIYNKGEMLK